MVIEIQTNLIPLNLLNEIKKIDRTETVKQMIERMKIIKYSTYAKYRGKLNMGDSG